MRVVRSCRDAQRGQVLILAGLFFCVLALFASMTIDVGAFYMQRRQTQNAADAAALAGSQELPGNPDLAKATAINWVKKNGKDPNAVTIGFKCVSKVAKVCLPGDGRYDTIVVTPRAKAPVFFSPVLSVMGIDSCWITGCEVNASAAGCKGPCGPLNTGPADVMMVLDHSYSMSDTDLKNAKNGITTMFGNFDNGYHNVGLAVTPPVNPSDMCDSINHWTDPMTWLPAPLTNTFQSSPHILNNSSAPVKYTNCVDRTDWPGGELQVDPGHTNVGNPIKAAADELKAHGRANTTWGMILLTDGAANVAAVTQVSGNTGQKFCTAQAAVTSSAGDNNGYQTNAAQACADGGGSASDADSGNGTSTSCTSMNKDRHRFSSFGNLDAAVPGGATIKGIEVRLDAWANSGASTRDLCVELSWNNGSSWTSSKSMGLSGTSEKTYTFGGSSDMWGRGVWSGTDLTNANFVVRVTNVASNTSTTFNLDAVGVTVHYVTTDTTQASKGPCDWAMKQADAAKAAGIEVYVIAWGASDKCEWEDSTSPWLNKSATTFLKAIATDSDHFYNEPKSTDLEPIFQAIGAQLSGNGTRLVE